MTPPSTAAARSVSAPISTLRRLPPLPGHALSWPTSPEPPAVQGTLALDTDLPVPPEATPHLVAVPDRLEHPGAGGPRAVAEHAMRARATRFTMAVVEAITGDGRWASWSAGRRPPSTTSWPSTPPRWG